jgi:hypothetical protein
MDPLNEDANGKEAVCSDERDDLVDRGEKGYSIDGTQQAKDEEAGEPIGRRRAGCHSIKLPIFRYGA